VRNPACAERRHDSTVFKPQEGPVDDTLETEWLRFIIECEHIDWEKLTDQELEDLVDDWCDQALEEGDKLDRKELQRQFRDWFDSNEFSR